MPWPLPDLLSGLFISYLYPFHSNCVTVQLYSMKLSIFTSVAFAVAATHASHVVHERRDSIPTAWADGERLHKKTILPVRIGLTQSNLHNADDLLMGVYVFSFFFFFFFLT